MTFTDVVNWTALVLALFLFLTAVYLIRPANGERPLLVGFMWSAMFAVYLTVVRLFEAQPQMRAVTGIAIVLWLSGKLWSIYATALHTKRPLLYSLNRLGRWVFGYNPPKPPSGE